MKHRARIARRAGRTAAAIALGLALGSLPFVYYRYGVGRHHVRHEVAETRGEPGAATAAQAANREIGGSDHASHAH